MLIIENLRKEYHKVVAVNNLSLKINDNEIFCLLGVNGAGKSTLIKMLSCLLKPTSGDALINDYSIVKNPYEIKKFIAVSLQETGIARNLTVLENLYFYAKLCGVDDQNRIDEIIKNFNFQNILNKKAKTLSGGWQRKLSIALSLVSNPQILLLDEPTLGLDVLSRRELWKVIEMLKKRMTIILTTHYMEEAEYLSDRIGVLKEGKLLKEGTLHELLDETKSNCLEDAFVKIVMGDK
ncbi:MAG: ABC transporter ATP-binding protein [Bacilli bacterium]|nr:ABC transporter ATP-binding protein [Bacilli bacterium]